MCVCVCVCVCVLYVLCVRTHGKCTRVFGQVQFSHSDSVRHEENTGKGTHSTQKRTAEGNTIIIGLSGPRDASETCMI